MESNFLKYAWNGILGLKWKSKLIIKYRMIKHWLVKIVNLNHKIMKSILEFIIVCPDRMYIGLILISILVSLSPSFCGGPVLKAFKYKRFSYLYKLNTNFRAGYSEVDSLVIWSIGILKPRYTYFKIVHFVHKSGSNL